MFTVRKVGEKSITGVKRIILIEDDGSETVINVSDAIHYIIAFAKADPEKPEEGVAAEILVKGNGGIVAEMFYQVGEGHPDFIKHCIRRSTEKIAEVVMSEIKKSGVDPVVEALKKMPTPEAKGGWN